MASDSERLLVLLEAKIADFEKKMAAAERRGSSTYTKLQKDSNSATKAMEADMIRSSGRINQALASASAKVGEFNSALSGLRGAAAVGALTAIVGAARTAARSVAEIGDAAERAGVSADAFQKLAYVAEQNRIPIDGLVDGLKELNLRADEFVITGQGPAAEAFARLGYSAEELKTKLADPSELIVEIIGRLGQLDKAAQIRIADEVFGGTAGERFVELIDEGEAGIRGMMDEAERLGIVMDDEMIAKAAELDRQFASIAMTISSNVKSAIVGAASALSDMLAQFQAWTQNPTVSKWLGYVGIAPTDDARRAVQRRMGATEDPRSREGRGINPADEIVLPEIVVEDDDKGGGGRKGGGAGRQRADDFQREAEALERRTAALVAGTAAQAAINPLMDDFGRASAEAAARTDLLLAAQQAGIQITPELRAQIEGLAQAYGAAEEAAGRLEDAQDFAKDRAEEWADLRQETTQGIVKDLLDGVSAADAFGKALSRVGDKLIDMALDGLFSGGGEGGGGGGGLFANLFKGAGGGGKGGLLGGIIIPGILHDGGVAGSDGYGHGRALPASTWAGAPRYHRGGIAGLRPNEVPAILQRGELVVPKKGFKETRSEDRPAEKQANGTLTIVPSPLFMAKLEGTIDAKIQNAAPGIVGAAVGQANQSAPAAVARYQHDTAGGEWRL